ncbi:MAG TPA: YXWGXW repeat-containing protein [Steroidobacteraceae bacterium]
MQASEAPPPLPDDEQPNCPDEGYLWTPGYWYWNAAGYYWVPGAWVQPPRVGVLWTPGYWEYANALYVFHRGYWAEHVGYYGGINYGFGYFGVGFAGGRWINRSFAYNRSVSNIDARVIHSTYGEPVHHNGTVSRVSYNGGPDGTSSVMTAREKALAAEHHFAPTSVQRQYAVQAARTPALMPHMPVSVYRSERSVDHRSIEATQKPAVLNAPALVAPRATAPASLAHQHELTRTPRSGRVLPQAIGARPITPAATRRALSKPLGTMPYPKS